MIKNSSKLMFTAMLLTGTMLTACANSWIGAWMGLEINMLAFIPLMSDTKNLMSSESSLKYFLVQAIASSVLLMAAVFSLASMKNFALGNPTASLTQTMILSALLMKTGAAPFHFWFPAVMEGLSWTNALVLMTWQKVAPMALISYLSASDMIWWSIIMTSVIGSLGGLNQSSLRKVMAFSSINHIGWMMAAMSSSETLWMTYFTLYALISTSLVMVFNLFKVHYFNQLFTMLFSSKPLKMALFMNFLSLGGLPPFLGFLPKWLVIQQLTANNQMMLMTVMTFFTLITLFFYLRMAFSALMLNQHENNWEYSTPINKTTINVYTTLNYLSITGLALISMVYIY